MHLQGRLGLVYRPHDFWLILLDALYQSLVVFFVALFAYAESDVGIWEFGTTITASCLFTNLVHGAIEIRSWVRGKLCVIIGIQYSNCIPLSIFEDGATCYLHSAKPRLVLSLLHCIQFNVRQLFRPALHLLGDFQMLWFCGALAGHIAVHSSRGAASVSYWHIR